MTFLRIDVDHCCFNRMLSYFRLITGLPIPFFLDHVWNTKQLLSGYNIPRRWFFRPLTCPDHFDEPFGLHSTDPLKFGEELESVESKLGSIKYFTRHGYARFASGRLWSSSEVQNIEKEYGVKDVSDNSHITISRLKETSIQGRLSNLDHVLFHPCYIKSHGKLLESVLQLILSLDKSEYLH